MQDNAKKKMYIAGLMIIIVFFLLLVVVIVFRGRKSSTVLNQPQTPTPTSDYSSIYVNKPNVDPKKIELKKITLTDEQKIESSNALYRWINSMQDSKNTYNQSIICSKNDPKTACQLEMNSYHAGIYTAWGRFHLFRTTGNNLQKEKLQSDLKTYADESIIPTIQNYFWNCKLMYELWNAPELDQTSKDNAVKICVRGLYEPAEYEPVIKVAEHIKEVTDANLDSALTGRSVLYGQATSSEKFIQNAAYSSDLAYKSKLYRDEKYLKQAQVFFLRALYTYGSEKQMYEENSGVLGIAAFDLFIITQNKKYLEIAKQIINDRTTRRCSFLFPCIIDYMLAKSLYLYTDDQKYNDMKENYLSEIINNFMDKEKFTKTSDFNGLYNQTTDSLIYPTRENALFLGVYAYE